MPCLCSPSSFNFNEISMKNSLYFLFVFGYHSVMLTILTCFCVYLTAHNGQYKWIVKNESSMVVSVQFHYFVLLFLMFSVFVLPQLMRQLTHDLIALLKGTDKIKVSRKINLHIHLRVLFITKNCNGWEKIQLTEMLIYSENISSGRKIM